MTDDYKRFCLRCGWNDSDYGCTSPSGEEVWQCPMYIHYHPAEVKKFNDDMSKREKEFISELTKNIPTWKLVLIDKWTDIKVWFWLKTHKTVRRKLKDELRKGE